MDVYAGLKKALTGLSLTIVLGLITSFAPPKDTFVIVKVDTQNINAGNIDQMVTLVDNRGGVSKPGRNGDFISDVDADKWIEWDGAPLVAESGDDVLVTKIRVKNDSDPEILKIKEANGSKMVRAKINKKIVEGTQAYEIHFTVIKADGSSASYILDPKLRMRASTGT